MQNPLYWALHQNAWDFLLAGLPKILNEWDTVILANENLVFPRNGG